MTNRPRPSSESPVPIARVVEPPRLERWLLVGTLLGLCGLVGILVVRGMQQYQRISITFDDGYGLRPGDPIRHRGIEVGRAVAMKLDPSLSSVTVDCDLYPGAETLARSGSQFWIARPMVSLRGVQGLDTLVGGRYIAVIPGPVAAEPMHQFEGLAEPPANAAALEGGLEIVLEAPHRFGLDRGTPVLFRGMQVGEVLSVALASDSMSVEARAVIAGEYRELVRKNSVFWKDSGVNVHLGIRGFDLDVGTFESFASGAVSLATPEPPDSLVHTGHRFPLEPKERDEWQDWRPRLAVGSASLPEGRTSPAMLRAERRSTRRNLLGLSREVRTGAWLLPLADGRILGPASLLETSETEEGPPDLLSFAGREVPLKGQQAEHFGQLFVLRPAEPLPPDTEGWPTARLRAPDGPEDCLVVADLGTSPIPLARGRFHPADHGWSVDPALAIHPDMLGSAVLSRKDGSLIGLVDIRDEQAVVLPIPPELVAEMDRSGLPSVK